VARQSVANIDPKSVNFSAVEKRLQEKIDKINQGANINIDSPRPSRPKREALELPKQSENRFERKEPEPRLPEHNLNSNPSSNTGGANPNQRSQQGFEDFGGGNNSYGNMGRQSPDQSIPIRDREQTNSSSREDVRNAFVGSNSNTDRYNNTNSNTDRYNNTNSNTDRYNNTNATTDRYNDRLMDKTSNFLSREMTPSINIQNNPTTNDGRPYGQSDTLGGNYQNRSYTNPNYPTEDISGEFSKLRQELANSRNYNQNNNDSALRNEIERLKFDMLKNNNQPAQAQPVVNNQYSNDLLKNEIERLKFDMLKNNNQSAQVQPVAHNQSNNDSALRNEIERLRIDILKNNNQPAQVQPVVNNQYSNDLLKNEIERLKFDMLKNNNQPAQVQPVAHNQNNNDSALRNEIDRLKFDMLKNNNQPAQAQPVVNNQYNNDLLKNEIEKLKLDLLKNQNDFANSLKLNSPRDGYNRLDIEFKNEIDNLRRELLKNQQELSIALKNPSYNAQDINFKNEIENLKFELIRNQNELENKLRNNTSIDSTLRGELNQLKADVIKNQNDLLWVLKNSNSNNASNNVNQPILSNNQNDNSLNSLKNDLKNEINRLHIENSIRSISNNDHTDLKLKNEIEQLKLEMFKNQQDLTNALKNSSGNNQDVMFRNEIERLKLDLLKNQNELESKLKNNTNNNQDINFKNEIEKLRLELLKNQNELESKLKNNTNNNQDINFKNEIEKLRLELLKNQSELENKLKNNNLNDVSLKNELSQLKIELLKNQNDLMLALKNSKEGATTYYNQPALNNKDEGYDLRHDITKLQLENSFKHANVNNGNDLALKNEIAKLKVEMLKNQHELENNLKNNSNQSPNYNDLTLRNEIDKLRLDLLKNQHELENNLKNNSNQAPNYNDLTLRNEIDKLRLDLLKNNNQDYVGLADLDKLKNDLVNLNQTSHYQDPKVDILKSQLDDLKSQLLVSIQDNKINNTFQLKDQYSYLKKEIEDLKLLKTSNIVSYNPIVDRDHNVYFKDDVSLLKNNLLKLENEIKLNDTKLELQANNSLTALKMDIENLKDKIVNVKSNSNNDIRPSFDNYYERQIEFNNREFKSELQNLKMDLAKTKQELEISKLQDNKSSNLDSKLEHMLMQIMENSQKNNEPKSNMLNELLQYKLIAGLIKEETPKSTYSDSNMSALHNVVNEVKALANTFNAISEQNNFDKFKQEYKNYLTEFKQEQKDLLKDLAKNLNTDYTNKNIDHTAKNELFDNVSDLYKETKAYLETLSKDKNSILSLLNDLKNTSNDNKKEVFIKLYEVLEALSSKNQVVSDLSNKVSNLGEGLARKLDSNSADIGSIYNKINALSQNPSQDLLSNLGANIKNNTEFQNKVLSILEDLKLGLHKEDSASLLDFKNNFMKVVSDINNNNAKILENIESKGANKSNNVDLLMLDIYNLLNDVNKRNDMLNDLYNYIANNTDDQTKVSSLLQEVKDIKDMLNKGQRYTSNFASLDKPKDNSSGSEGEKKIDVSANMEKLYSEISKKVNVNSKLEDGINTTKNPNILEKK
jgi:hypothetical protein